MQQNALDAWRDTRDHALEWAFLFTYGNPWLQAAMGVDPRETRTLRRAGESLLQRQLIEARITELRSRIAQGGLREALTRALLYVGIARGSVDERGVAALRRTRIAEDGMPRLTLSEFKGMVREQSSMLLLDPDTALRVIPGMLPRNPDLRRKSFIALYELLRARGEITGEAAQRLRRIAELFGVEMEAWPVPDNPAHPVSVQAKAS